MTAVIRASVFFAALVGCHSSPELTRPTSPPPAEDRPFATIAFAEGANVQVLEVSSHGGIKVVRDVTTPIPVAQLEWFGSDPVVLLATPACGLATMPGDTSACGELNEAFEGEIGRITARDGFVAYPPLPAATWDGLAAPNAQESECERGCWSMTLNDTLEGDGGVYQGHCRSAFPADGSMICDKWLYARIDAAGPPLKAVPRKPRPVVPPRKEPSAAPPPVAPPTVAPSPSVALELVVQDHEAPYGGKLTQLRCTIGSDTTTYPDLEEIDLGMGEDAVRWITTDPPRFIARHGRGGLVGHNDPVLYEGCTPRLIDEPIEGWDDMIIVDGVLYQRGAILGSVPHARLVVFAP